MPAHPMELHSLVGPRDPGNTKAQDVWPRSLTASPGRAHGSGTGRRSCLRREPVRCRNRCKTYPTTRPSSHASSVHAQQAAQPAKPAAVCELGGVARGWFRRAPPTSSAEPGGCLRIFRAQCRPAAATWAARPAVMRLHPYRGGCRKWRFESEKPSHNPVIIACAGGSDGGQVAPGVWATEPRGAARVCAQRPAGMHLQRAGRPQGGCGCWVRCPVTDGRHSRCSSCHCRGRAAAALRRTSRAAPLTALSPARRSSLTRTSSASSA